MKRQAVNPYLPFWETVPDGEPHVFGDRVYLFGSHDRPGGDNFCLEDYVCWSAPVNDLADWRCEGVIYRKEQDPINGAPYGKPLPEYDAAFDNGQAHLLYAPDVARGPDGRYYLYYSLDFTNIISVAVCDTPAGQYEFLDYVTRADGTRPNIGRWFDPAILCEEGGNYLYYGFCPPARFPGMEALAIPGGMVVRLADDMHTIVSEPTCTANGCDTCKGTPYEAHPFFEASSIRHYGEWYYLVYSSLQGHELCYGMAKTPKGPFEYRGVLHSNGDLGLNGNELPTNYTGNNHGGLVQIGDAFYIFGHRHTRGTAYSRQGVAERVERRADGTFRQAEQTSCGLNGGPLAAEGAYSAHIACHLTGPDRSKVGRVVMSSPEGGDLALPEDMPYLTAEPCEGGDHGLRPYARNLRAGAVCGFKYFDFGAGTDAVTATVRGEGTIALACEPEGEIVSRADFASGDWCDVRLSTQGIRGVRPVYFRVLAGRGDLAGFSFGGKEKPEPEEARLAREHAELTKRTLRRSYRDLNKIAVKGQTLFTGSSLMEQFPVNEIAMSMGVPGIFYNRGVGGTTTDEFLEHIDTVLLDLEPSKVFINIGTNDIAPRPDGEYWQDHLLRNYETIIRILRERLPDTEVYMMAYYPVNPSLPGAPEWTKYAFQTRSNAALCDTNEKLAALAARAGVHFIDCNDNIKDESGNLRAEFTKEGMHLYPAAYIEVFQALRPYL